MDKRVLAAGITAAAIVGSIAVSTASSATPPSSPGPTPSGMVVGTLDGPTKAKKNNIELEVDSDTTVRNFTLTYPPNANSGWHSHPGIVLAVVKSGTVERRLADCSAPQTFTAGQAFTEVPGHFVSNPSSTAPAELEITQLFPAGTPAAELRVDLPQPAC